MRGIFRQPYGGGGFGRRFGYHRYGGFHQRPWFRGHHWGGPLQPTPDPQVQMAQACLAQSVDPSVPQDGIMGPQTRQAIMTYQTQQQMQPTGMLDPNTISALQACQPPAPPPPPPPPPQVQVSPPQTGSRHSQQQEAFIGDILGSAIGPLGPLGGIIGGLFQGGSQPEPPPPPPPPFGFPQDFHDRWRGDRNRRGRWHREMEGEFPFEESDRDFHPHHGFHGDRDRWSRHHHGGERWGRDRGGHLPYERPFFGFHRHEGFSEGGEGCSCHHHRHELRGHDREGEIREEEHVMRPVVERAVLGRPEIVRPEFRRPEFVRPGFDFHARDRFRDRGRWGWNRDRGGFDRP
jgi:hypothetical protein